MKVLLIKDVYKLGRAGEIKKVADGYGRNYLIPQGLALPATESSVKLAEAIGHKASERRAVLNTELKGLAEILSSLQLEFPVKASETGKLYGSVTSQMVAEQVKELKGIELDRRQIELEPIRALGEYEVPVHLTMDLVPMLQVIVRREGEASKARPAKAAEAAEQVSEEAPAVETEENTGA
ncbi:MAG TPA: 50S ribosomal protein L9 [Anaerolineaceae bacterium]|mgnify:FL=1|jgi:large subunit ribosomal protein L9|nr:50S ribosomal protein L9 [Anaerolineaceae bacterium]